jgi:hypothetical protein
LLAYSGNDRGGTLKTIFSWLVSVGMRRVHSYMYLPTYLSKEGVAISMLPNSGVHIPLLRGQPLHQYYYS